MGLIISYAAGVFDPLLNKQTQAAFLDVTPSVLHELDEPTPTPMPTSLPANTAVEAAPTPAGSPFATPSAPLGADAEDVLLLYNSTRPTNFDVNFCKIAEYYGLLCKQFDLMGNLTPADLQDSSGQTFKLIGISATDFPQLSDPEIALLQSAVSADGANLLIYEVGPSVDRSVLSALTNGKMIGAIASHDSVRDWTVTTTAPEVTREFSGWYIELTEVMRQLDNMLTIRDETAVEPLITSSDDYSKPFTMFARTTFGSGMVYVHSGDKGESSIGEVQLRSLYYRPENFTVVVPLMMTMSYVMGDEAWHNPTNVANLTLDDPPLTAEFANLNYEGLLAQMEAHNFFTTIAFMPYNLNISEPDTISLVKNNPDHYSLVQHGNNGDAYEFYLYTLPTPEPVGPGTPEAPASQFAAHPLSEQEADIEEGLVRMLHHQQTTGVPFDRVMIFPYGISPEETLVTLKRLNFLGTVNAQEIPLGAERTGAWDEGMYVATLDYANFPVVPRREYINSFSNPNPFIQDAIFDLFIDRPALFWSHPFEDELFTKGLDEFNVVADRLNALPGDLQWESLGDVLRHSYRMKAADDGSIEVQMFSPEAILENNSSTERIYHITKPETLNVPIQAVMINGASYPYRVENGTLTVDVVLPSHTSIDLHIIYQNQLNVSASN